MINFRSIMDFSYGTNGTALYGAAFGGSVSISGDGTRGYVSDNVDALSISAKFF